MKNPFVPGDIIWFFYDNLPSQVYVCVQPGWFESAQDEGWYPLEEVLEDNRFYRGPYRVTKTEDWSNYNFEESSA